MKQLVLKESWATKRMKALRFLLISLPGRIIKKAGQLVIRITHGHPSLNVLLEARQRIVEPGLCGIGVITKELKTIRRFLLS